MLNASHAAVLGACPALDLRAIAQSYAWAKLQPSGSHAQLALSRLAEELSDSGAHEASTPVNAQHAASHSESSQARLGDQPDLAWASRDFHSTLLSPPPHASPIATAPAWQAVRPQSGLASHLTAHAEMAASRIFISKTLH